MKTVKQFFQFGVIGLLNTAIDIGLYMFLTYISVHFAAAQVISYLAGMLNSYIWNNKVTFSNESNRNIHKGENISKMIKFLIWNVGMLLLSIALLYLLHDWIMLDSLLSKIIVTIFVVCVNFAGSKYWVFSDRKKQVSPP